MAFVEALCLAHGHEFNPAFATETSRIDPLPHQRIAVYERMLEQDPLRFLLADDAGAGKTIMTGLLVRELLSRERLRRVLIVPPAGLVGNWERELRTLFRLRFGIYTRKTGNANPFRDGAGDRLVVSLDTLRQETAFEALSDPEVPPYDLVVFDEAHKLSVSQDGKGVRKTRRYELAEALAGCEARSRRFAELRWSARHLLLLTATPHMGRDLPYHSLWRLLDHRTFSTGEAVRHLETRTRERHFLRRTKEEMVNLRGDPLYRRRYCNTFSYDLSRGPDGEQELYEQTTSYLREFYGQALSNRPAVQLAMSVFQRRLASSTWALLRSFERRIEKLEKISRSLENGETDLDMLHSQQARTKYSDLFDSSSADEEGDGTGGRERNEHGEDELLGALAAVTIEELRTEIGVLRELRDRAKRLHESGDESKFRELQRVLEEPVHAAEKWLIFSEHRDTVDYLVRRLEGLGYAGRVAQIHGGMAWPEREDQMARFRDETGADFLIATDAAGEGINLQFCHLMVNYDIPWNPARLEQRMGRIHRYGQQHEVRIVNLISKDTREGRVLAVLLEKLESIRHELTSDKVFDVVGRLFENQSLSEYMRSALTDEGERAAQNAVTARLQTKRVRQIEATEASVYGQPGDVASRLPEIQSQMDREQYLRLLPAYVRRFVERSAPLLEVQVRGDLNRFFHFAPPRTRELEPLRKALNALSEEERIRLSVRRLADGAPGVWLHPGEPVFDALASAIRNRFQRDARRGAIFVDRQATEPYLAHLGLASVEEEIRGRHSHIGPGRLLSERRGPARRTRERRLVALRHGERERPAAMQTEGMLLLHGAPQVAPGAVPLASRSLSMQDEAAAHLQETAEQMVRHHREAMRKRATRLARELAAGYDLRSAELSRRRRQLRRRRERDLAAMRDVRRQQVALDAEKQRALEKLERRPERIHPGKPHLLAHALVIPPLDPTEVDADDANVEAIAVQIASEWERERGGHVSDVSKPRLARAAGLADAPGFDLISLRGDGEQRRIEVKGRAGQGVVHLTGNEWRQAFHLGADYWLYVVFDCATPAPRLHRVRDPAAKLLASHRTIESFAIPAKSVIAAAETQVGTAGPIFRQNIAMS